MSLTSSDVRVEPNDNPKEREDRHGRVRVCHRRTWVLVVNGEQVDEYRRKKDAQKAAARIIEAEWKKETR